MRGAQSFFEGAHRVELAGLLRAADDAKWYAQRANRFEQRVIAFLTGCDDDGVGLDRALRSIGRSDPDTAGNDCVVANVCQRFDSGSTQGSQHGPTRRLADPFADRRTASHQRDLFSSDHEQRAIRRRGQALLVKKTGAFVDGRLAETQVMRDVDADSAGSYDRNAIADRAAAQQHVRIRQYVRKIAAGKPGLARKDSGREHDRVEAVQQAHIVETAVQSHGHV